MSIESILALATYFAYVLPVGWVLARFIPIQERYMRLALSYELGTVILSLELFVYFFILRFNFSLYLLIFVFLQALICLLFLIYYRQKNQQLHFNFKNFKLPEIILVVLISICIIFPALQATVKPTIAFDAIVNWSKRSKILLYEGSVDFNPLSDVYLAVPGNSTYPWHSSLLEYWLRQLGGGDIAVNFIPLSSFICIIFVLYYSLSQRLSRLISLSLVFFFASMPLIAYHSINPYADLTLAFFVVTSLALFVQWLEKRTDIFLYFSAFFIGWGFFIKNDGMFSILAWLGALGVAWWLDKKSLSWKLLFKSISFMIVPLVFWLGFRVVYNLGLHSIASINNIHTEIFSPIIRSFFIFNNWNVWWYIFILIIILRFKSFRKNFTFLTVLSFFLLYLGAIIFTYLTSGYYQFALDPRTFIPLIPISILLVGLALEEKSKVSV
ncbi:hypothetical protein IPN41_01370 [Candidatus Falkowbacteria bacterium]|nr:MAG: hypothetical protein IPN41_01370 [Candidatus Falkowbacteria bacterium]